MSIPTSEELVAEGEKYLKLHLKAGHLTEEEAAQLNSEKELENFARLLRGLPMRDEPDVPGLEPNHRFIVRLLGIQNPAIGLMPIKFDDIPAAILLMRPPEGSPYAADALAPVALILDVSLLQHLQAHFKSVDGKPLLGKIADVKLA